MADYDQDVYGTAEIELLHHLAPHLGTSPEVLVRLLADDVPRGFDLLRYLPTEVLVLWPELSLSGRFLMGIYARWLAGRHTGDWSGE